jgi:hypothetical protein
MDYYKTKKNNWVSQAFMNKYLDENDDCWYCHPINIAISIPMWRNPNNTALDISELLWD